MWIAENWKDYEVLDTSKGEKLERWGDYTLVRPDPQVIWDTPKTLRGWKRPNAHYHRSKRGGGEWEFFDLPEQWSLHYQKLGLTFQLKPFSFKHTGLFPEQATNWDWFSEKIKKAGRPIKVLNLFAYTGGATLAAAAAVDWRTLAICTVWLMGCENCLRYWINDWIIPIVILPSIAKALPTITTNTYPRFAIPWVTGTMVLDINWDLQPLSYKVLLVSSNSSMVSSSVP